MLTLSSLAAPLVATTATSLRWRHNDHAGVSNHQPHGCLLNRLFGRKSKKTSKLRVTGLCAGNSPGTGEFPAQMASYAENVSIWWRHHVRCHQKRHCWHFEKSRFSVNIYIYICLFSQEGGFPWNPSEQSFLLSAFYYGYIVLQLPGGYLAERLSGKLMFGLGIVVPGVLNLLMPLMANYGVAAFGAMRILCGLAAVSWLEKNMFLYIKLTFDMSIIHRQRH